MVNTHTQKNTQNFQSNSKNCMCNTTASGHNDPDLHPPPHSFLGPIHLHKIYMYLAQSSEIICSLFINCFCNRHLDVYFMYIDTDYIRTCKRTNACVQIDSIVNLFLQFCLKLIVFWSAHYFFVNLLFSCIHIFQILSISGKLQLFLILRD